MATMESGLAQVGAGDADVVAGEVGELYRSLGKSLERIVRVAVHAPEPIIEEACQFAWGRLVDHQWRVHRQTVLGWLARTATREAFKQLRRASRELPLDAPETEEELERVLGSPEPADLFERRDRLASVASLPARQQRLLWLRGLGLSYGEIALRDGCTTRTVERQLLHARTALRASAGD